jgi:hypothetical protein
MNPGKITIRGRSYGQANAKQKTPLPGMNLRSGVSVLAVGTQQREKQGENHESLSGGAPGGATWSEIRGVDCSV